MRILALDISKAGTGVAIGDATEAPRSFVASFSGATRGHVCANYAKWMRDLLMVEKPALVVFEAPLMRAAAKGSADAMRLLIGLATQTEVMCAIRNIPSHDCHVASWRKAFLGHGYPHDPKRAALNMCGLLGWDVGGSHDRADACGVWAWAHLNHGARRAIMRALSASSVRSMA